MKKTLFILMMSTGVWLQAQKTIALVINGGKFEYGVSSYEDRATLGMIDLQSKEYKVIDTIEVESAQKIAASTRTDGQIFVAAQDSIIGYTYNPSFNTFQRIAQIEFSGIKTIAANDQYLIAGKWYGSGDYLVIYDLNSLSPVYASPTIKSEIKDLLITQDGFLAVSYNLQGSVDNCAPYGCYTDSVGRIDIIDLEKLETIKTIDLGARGKGNITLSEGINGSAKLFSVSSDNQLITLISDSWEISKDSINSGVESLITEYSAYNYGAVFGVNDQDSVVYLYYFPSNDSLQITKGLYSAHTKAIWNSDGTISYIETDYSSFGRVLLNYEKDTVEVGISPEDIYVGYFGALGIWSNEYETDKANTIFDSEIAGLDLSNLSLFDLSGNLIYESSENTLEGLDFLSSGLYILKAMEDNLPISLRLIKE